MKVREIIEIVSLVKELRSNFNRAHLKEVDIEIEMTHQLDRLELLVKMLLDHII